MSQIESMSCPPGKLFNPRTGRCTTYTAKPPCPPGTERNPATGRCIKIGGRVYKQLHPQEKLAPQPPSPLPPPPVLAVGTAAAVPMGIYPEQMIEWVKTECRNPVDPITGLAWSAAEAAALQQVIRLHDATCTFANPLHHKVAAEHKRGQPATIPGESTHMTLDDFKVLRDVMRRTDPKYKLPARRHQPPPSNWQFYLASDNRSGPEFASVMYVDVTKVRLGAYGRPEFPADSVMVDLGFVPLYPIPGQLCTTQTLVSTLKMLADSNRLLNPVAGGWKPVAGLPHTKDYWNTDAAAKISRLCRELVRVATLPI